MKIADGELRKLLTQNLKIPAAAVRELVADSNQTGHSLQQVVEAAKVTDNTTLAKAYAKRLGVPFVDLEANPVNIEAVGALPRPIARKHKAICFEQTQTSLKVAMADPNDETARKALKDYSSKTIRRYLATSRGLTKAMRAYNAKHAPRPLTAREMIITILEQALRHKARDIHFEPQVNELVIRRRNGRQLLPVSRLPISSAPSLIAWCKLQAGNEVSDAEHTHHGRFSMKLDGTAYDVLMSTIPVVNGEKMVLRIVPLAQRIPTLATIGFSNNHIKELSSLVENGHGMIIIAGSKETDVQTTLARLTIMSSQQPHTITASIEDPLQYRLDNVNQTEVNRELSFSDAVSTVVGQSPSTIVVSQLGNSVAFQQLVDFSLAQHLVISGLHAASLHQAIAQITKRPVAAALIAAGLRLVVVQHQLDALCSKCRVTFKPAGPLKSVLHKQFYLAPKTLLYRRGTGCDACNKGVCGTVFAYEWLLVNTKLQQELATGIDNDGLAHLIDQTNFRWQLGQLASKGVISIDTATKQMEL